MSPIMDALRAFDATEANVVKLRRLWDELQTLFPASASLDGAPAYEDRCRSFEGVLRALPMIDGWKPDPCPPDPDGVAATRFDLMELGDPLAEAQFETGLWAGGRHIDEYRFRLDRKRRALIRDALLGVLDDFEAVLREVENAVVDAARHEELGGRPAWRRLRELADQVEVLLGSSMPKPPGWANLRRHLHFGMVGDLRDIARNDWPTAKADLVQGLYGSDEPLPVATADLGELVAAKPRGPVVTGLDWGKLDAAGFERLIFALIGAERGYENPEWLMRTNAPDRGRDLSAFRVIVDPHSGTRRERVIVQCKHWLSRSVGPPEAILAKEQTTLWSDPRVDVLVIATTSRFSSDAVQWVERHNAAGAVPRIEMWPESHLERLLAARPALVAEFGLR